MLQMAPWGYSVSLPGIRPLLNISVKRIFLGLLCRGLHVTAQVAFAYAVAFVMRVAYGFAAQIGGAYAGRQGALWAHEE